MKFFKLKFIGLLILSILVSSCGSDDDAIPQQEILNSEFEGLLGGRILIKGKNLQPGKLQVFFDTEKASITAFSNEAIEVIVPRTIERFNPTLKVVDLITNEDILNETFILYEPHIESYETDEISFEEVLVVHGANFDNRKDQIRVLINDEQATVLNATHNRLELHIPEQIRVSALEVTIEAQLQSITSSLSLKLKDPIINEVSNEIAWLGGYLDVTGNHFNPNIEFGEVYINGVPAHYTSSTKGLKIQIPHGPYSEFKIHNITYKTAGLTTSFDLNLEIGNVGIMVDGFKNFIGREIIVYKDKAYAFSFEYLEDESTVYYLNEFSPVTEKWTKIDGFSCSGYLNNIVFDNSNSIYLYKTVGDEVNELTRLNLDTFKETKIETPFDPALRNITLLVHGGDLYVLNGEILKEDRLERSSLRYKYIKARSEWEKITTDLFSGYEWQNGIIYHFIYLNNELYFEYFDKETFRLDSNYQLTHVEVDDMLFLYKGSIICKRANIVNSRMLLYTLGDPYTGVELQFGREESSVNSFFSINNEIYFNMIAPFYNGSVHNATFRLKKEELYEIL